MRAAALLESDAASGLSSAEAAARLRRVGPNVIGREEDVTLWRLALRQFRSLVVLLLLAASLVAFLAGEPLESLAILAALGINALIGFLSEWRAQRSLARLRAMAFPWATVRRDGQAQRLPTERLVPGDLIVLEAGSSVPADARLVRSARLMLDEAPLTGESLPADKDAGAILPAETPLPERRGMVYLGTSVLAGSAEALVTATGEATELGRIGQLVALAGDKATPLERQVETLGRRLMVLALLVCAVVAAAGVLKGLPWVLMVETAISLAVAAIPEGLPAVTTLALAAGLWRLARSGALVRRLSAVESLGSTTVICTDKTGTLTQNRMRVTRLWVEGRQVSVRDEAAAPLLRAAALVNDAPAGEAPASGGAVGDPTDVALVEAAREAGLDPAALRRSMPRVAEIPFDAANRFMATWHAVPEGETVLYVKGAPEVLLARASHVRDATGARPLQASDERLFREQNDAMAGDGLRVLAVAEMRQEAGALPPVEGLTLLGLVGLEDPLRPEAPAAIETCRQAGIRTIMLTGDQRATAEAVARRLGLAPDSVRSRVSPEQKLQLVQELQASGEIVAMTGDGVNDAPALAHADVGVAMGRHGTDVAREAADIVLTDDNFASIVLAVREGRTIHDNLRKVIRFLFSCNLSEIFALLGGIVLGYPPLLMPLQILWVNLVTDIAPAMALIREPANPRVMSRPARRPGSGLVTAGAAAWMVVEGAILVSGVIGVYVLEAVRGGAGPRAGTMAFVAIVLVHPLQALNCRSWEQGWWRLPSNPLIWFSMALLAALQWGVTSWPPMARLLGVVPLGGYDWMVVSLFVIAPYVVLEIIKALRRKRTGR
jgi:P-type Ca2+ transporter type 2C